jgi:hypothetical protein
MAKQISMPTGLRRYLETRLIGTNVDKFVVKRLFGRWQYSSDLRGSR